MVAPSLPVQPARHSDVRIPVVRGPGYDTPGIPQPSIVHRTTARLFDRVYYARLDCAGLGTIDTIDLPIENVTSRSGIGASV